MLNLEAIPEHVRAWVEGHLIPELSRLETEAHDRLTALESWAQAHGGYADSVLAAVEELAKTIDPAAAVEVTAAVATAKTVGADAKRLLDEVLARV